MFEHVRLFATDPAASECCYATVPSRLGRHRSDGEPDPRPQYRADCYGAFLLDPT